MKILFTKNEILVGKGCYSKEQVLALSFIEEKSISIETILKSEISIKDKRWFVYNNCDLTLQEKQKLSLLLAWAVLPIYENKYPNDLRVKECLQAVENFNNNKISVKELREKRNAADAAAYAADAAAADAADAADAAAAADADAAAYAGNLTYSQKLQQILIDFVK